MKRDEAWREKRLRYLLESERSEEEAYAKFHKEVPGEKPDEAPKDVASMEVLKEGKGIRLRKRQAPKESKP